MSEQKEKGVWRTICGRKVFIKDGQSLTEAMKASGKFSKSDIKVASEKRNTKTSEVRVCEPTITVRIDYDGNIVSRKKQVKNYVERFRAGEQVDAEIEVVAVGDREREEIEKLTHKKVTATTHVLSVDELRHIEKRHGENGEQDHSMADVSNYQHIAEVLHDPDPNGVKYCRDKDGKIARSSKYKDKNNQPAEKVMFTKTFNNHIQMVVEAVTDTKAGKLRIISSYTKKKPKIDDKK